MPQRGIMNSKSSETQADFSFSWYFFFSLYAPKVKRKRSTYPKHTKQLQKQTFFPKIKWCNKLHPTAGRHYYLNSILDMYFLFLCLAYSKKKKVRKKKKSTLPIRICKNFSAQIFRHKT